jgi:hypothetical protein
MVLVAVGLQAQQPNPQAAAASAKPSAANAPHLDPGEVADGVYHNLLFGFTFKIPFGWVDRTDVMRQDSTGNAKAVPSKSMVLLATFERPPEASEQGVNAGVVIAAESVSSYPGLKDASQYFQPLEEVAKSKDLKVVNEPYDFPVDGMSIVRQDFSKKMANATVYQSTLVMLQKGYALSFTFLGSSDDEITNLFDNLRFGRVKQAKSR